jgi:heat shock protein HslJ
MNKIFFYAMVLVVALSVGACEKRTAQGVPDIHNSRNSLDWGGTYFGTLPCASCPGIDVELSLRSDLTYTLLSVYQDHPGTFVDSDTFAWNDEGSKIKLQTGNDAAGFQHFQVRENALVLLTISGEAIKDGNDNMYILKKAEGDAATLGITNRYWKLVELNGNSVTYPEFSREAFVLMTLDGRIRGNLGCNSFFGSFALEEGDRISFSQLGNTQMMCIDMSIEDEVKNVLQNADNYNLNEKQLVLNRARMAPLARFEAVYMDQN